MLVLSRKVGEELKLGDDITVKVVRLGNGNVRLGISAPREMKVKRVELDSPIPNLTRLGLPDDGGRDEAAR